MGLMGLSPASRHRLRVEAEQQAAESTLPQGVAYAYQQRNQYTLFLIKMQQDLVRLSRIKSRTRKSVIKAELIPDYLPYVEAVMQAGHSAQDAVLVRVMVWYIDTEQYPQALELAGFALQNKMVMPEGFSRDLPEVVAEEIAEAALHHAKPSVLLETLQAVHALVHPYDIKDEVAAKLYKALGLAFENIDDRKALYAFERAYQFNPKISVKRYLNRLQKKQENLNE
jgi:hypothetical protein